MKLSDYRALHGVLLLSSAIFAICQARPQSTDSSTTTLGVDPAAELQEKAILNAKSEEDVIRYNVHSTDFLTVRNRSAFTNSIWTETKTNASGSGYNTTGVKLKKGNITSMGSQHNNPNIHILKSLDSRLEKGHITMKGMDDHVGFWKNYTDSQGFLSILKNQVRHGSIQDPEHFDRAKFNNSEYSQIINASKILTNSQAKQEHKFNNVHDQNVTVTPQEFPNGSRDIFCTQGCIRNYSVDGNITRSDAYISSKNFSQHSLHEATVSYMPMSNSNSRRTPLYLYAQPIDAQKNNHSLTSNFLLLHSQNTSKPYEIQHSLNDKTSQHSINEEIAAQRIENGVPLETILSKNNNYITVNHYEKYLPFISENLSLKPHSDVLVNSLNYRLYPKIQNTLNSSQENIESGQIGAPQGLEIVRKLLKNQNIIDTIKHWGSVLINKFNQIFQQKDHVSSLKQEKDSLTEGSRAILTLSGSERKAKIFLKNGTKPLQLVHFVPVESVIKNNSSYLHSKPFPRSRKKPNAISFITGNNTTNIYVKRFNFSRNVNTMNPNISVVTRNNESNMRTRIIKRNNYTNVPEGRNQRLSFTKQYLPQRVHKNNNMAFRASNITQRVLFNTSSGRAHQMSWLPIGLSPRTQSTEVQQISQVKTFGKECIIRSSTGKIRPCNRKQNSTEETQKQMAKTLLTSESLVKNFVATNIQDLRVPSKEQANKGVVTSSQNFPYKKNWPGDGSGIESLDDLILYHTYTQNKPSVTVTPQVDGGYVSIIKKPSVTLHWGQSPSTVSSTMVNYRPTETSTVPNTQYSYSYDDYNIESSYLDTHSTTMYPVVLITPRPTPQPSTHSPYYPPAYGPPLAQDDYYDYPSSSSRPPIIKPPKCPNIIISTKGNTTVDGKEGCPDVNILITSDITNNNLVVGGSSSTTTAANGPLFDEAFGTTMTIPTSAPNVPSSPGTFTSTLSNIVSGMMSSQLAYPVLYFFLAPLLVVMTGGIGLAALLFPWMFAWRSIGREERRLQRKSFLMQQFGQPRKRRVRLEQGEGGNVQDATASTHNSSSNRETVGRAKDSSPPQLGDSIHSLATQLLGSRYYDSGLENTESASDDSMVEEDIRTPPKLKSQLHKYKNSHKPVVATASVDFAEDKGTKGVAVPVIIDEDDDLEKTMERLSGVQSESAQWQSTTPKRKYMESTSTRKPRPTTTTMKPNHDSTASDESSTWILLSESSPPTTPSFNKRRKIPSSTTQRITTAHSQPELLQTSASYSLASSSFNHNIKKPQRLTATTTTASPNIKTTRLPSPENNAHSSDRVAESSNSSSVENSKPGLLTGNSNNRNNSNIPNRTRKPVVQAVNNKVKPTTNTPTPEFGITRHRPVQQKMTITSRPPTTITTLKLPEITTPIAAVEEEVTTAMEMVEEHSETTTKRSRHPQHSSEDNKKRKKNKNRRRRPTKRPSNNDLESKTADNNTTSSNTNQKIATKERPLTTRIYNYLAREVMPSFGVGLLGLVVTAGLAGLIMYPFGGAAPSRRTYEELGTSHYGQPNPYYYRGEYDQGEVEGLSEEEVFGKLLEGMNDKGEFTYSGLKDDNTAYGSASPSGYSSTLYRTADNVATSYNTKSQVSAVDSRINEGTRISTAGSVPQKHPVYAEGSLQETSSSNSYKYSPESQQYYSGSANLNRNSHYSSMATRSSEVSGGVDSQSPLYVGSVSVGAKGPQQYISGSVHKDNNPHGSESNSNYRTSSSTGYYKTSNIAGTGSYSSSDYKAPNSEESINHYKTNHEELPVAQAYTMYDGFKGVQGQNYGNVQLDTKYSVHPQDSPNVQNKQNAGSYSNIPSPQSNQYQGAPQYRDTYDSHSWVISGLTFTTETPQEMSLSKHVKQEDISKNVSANVTKVQNITKVGVEDAIPVSSEISSRLSPTLQKRVYGIIEHGPRSLRRRRGVPEVEDERFNEIDSLIPNKINDHSVLPTDQANSTPNTNQEETTTNLKQTESPSTTESTTTTDVSTRSIDYVTTLLNEETTTKGSNEPLFVTTLQSEINTNNEEEMEEADEEESDNDEEDYTATSASTTEATAAGETEGDESVTEASEKFSLMGLFRRIARFKIRLGLNLLRSTSEAFTNYIDRVQKRLDKNDIVKSNARNSKVNSRIKRSADLKSTSAGGKKLLEMLKEYHKKHRTPSRSKSV